MKAFMVTSQVSQDINDTGWQQTPIFAEDRAEALRRFNQLAEMKPGWLRASIENVVESRVHNNVVVAG